MIQQPKTMNKAQQQALANLFARTEHATKHGCSWCGGFRSYGGVATPRLFSYYTETDTGRRHPHDGLFCCKSCHDTYHNRR